MAALPKRKIGQTRRDNRRAQWKIKRTQLVTCPQCGAPARPHHVCLSCGTFRGTQVLEIEED